MTKEFYYAISKFFPDNEKKYYPEIVNNMVGKTIQSIDDTCVNVLKFYFTDGTMIELFAECGTSATDIPFFMLNRADDN